MSNGSTTSDILTNDQLLKADFYKPLIVGYHNGAAVKLSDVADVEDSVQNIRASGYVDGKPCVTLIIFRQPGANIIETVEQIQTGAAFAESVDSGGNRPDDGRRPDDHHPSFGTRRRSARCRFRSRS